MFAVLLGLVIGLVFSLHVVRGRCLDVALACGIVNDMLRGLVLGLSIAFGAFDMKSQQPFGLRWFGGK